MATKSDYPSDETEAGLLVAIEVMELLDKYHNDFVLIGGWAPYLLARLNPEAELHSGSIDVDIALRNTLISNHLGDIDKILRSNGYYKKEGDPPLVYNKDVLLSSAKPISVRLDLMPAEIKAGIHSQYDRGMDLVLLTPWIIKTTDIGIKVASCKEHVVDIRVANIVPLLIMKTSALNSRDKQQKDAYDIYYLCKYYPDGLDQVILSLKMYVQRPLIRDTLEILRVWFKNIHARGPQAVVEFLELDNEEERIIIRRDVFEQIDYILARLGF